MATRGQLVVEMSRYESIESGVNFIAWIERINTRYVIFDTFDYPGHGLVEYWETFSLILEDHLMSCCLFMDRPLPSVHSVSHAALVVGLDSHSLNTVQVGDF